MFKSVFKNKEIEFLCLEEDYGLIPQPYPASKNIPDWYKALPMKMENKGFETSTLKRCMPVLDTMVVGYIIPLCADVEFVVNEDASGLTYKTKFHKNVVEVHRPEQISHDKCPSPLVPRPPLKFLNYWYIKTPPEYSLLFVQPLNRFESRFTCFSGIVDYPYYLQEYINFPFVFNEKNFSGIIPAGTPLMQVIPIKKDNLLTKHRSRVISDDEFKDSTMMRRVRDMVHESLYRDNIHRKL